MYRFLTILWVAWRFGLGELVLSTVAKPWARRLCYLFFRHSHRDTGAVRLRLALEHLGPIFVKFGQLLSTRRDLLPTVYANELEKLQDKVPPEDFTKIEKILHDTYQCPPEDIFSEFDKTPVGSASVAQVHRAILKDSGNEVAVKILRPNVKQRIAGDLKLMKTCGTACAVSLKRRRTPTPVCGGGGI